MKLSRTARLFFLLGWVFFVLYPDPGLLQRSIHNFRHADVDAAAVVGLARRLPDKPRLIERAVLDTVVPYSYDWQTSGVPWYFPTTAEVLKAGRGDCESRALVLASILKAKGIPYRLRLSFDHIWVDYPGKQPNAWENDRVAMGERRNGRFVLFWPQDFHPWQELQAQLAIYWTPMPPLRKLLLLAGLLLVPLWNALAALAGRLLRCPPPLSLWPGSAWRLRRRRLARRARGLALGRQRV